MGHKAIFTERLGVENGKLYRFINASWKDIKMRVLKQEVGSSDKYVRNLDCNNICGWLFYAPTDTLPYCSSEIGVEKYFKCMCACNIVGTSEMTYDEVMDLLEKTPYKEFNYTIKYLKSKDNDNLINLCELFELLGNWTKNKRVELLVKADLTKLALNGSFLRLTDEKQKAVIKVAQSGKAPNYASVNDLLIMARTNCDYNLVAYGGDQKLKDYLLEQNEYLAYYKDYLKMAKRLKKNIKENYWKYPKNLVEAHNKCEKEIEELEQAELLIREEKEAEKLAKENKTLNRKIKSIAKKTASLNKTINGYEIVVAQSLEDIKTQAEVLDQCLITCSYFKEHANKKCLLVFIKKGKKRLATAEVFYDRENPLGQFYADERDRKNCKPNKAITSAFNTWLNQTYLTSNLCVA